MPIIEIKMLEGRDIEQKKALVKELTNATCKTIGSKPEKVRVIINEIPKKHYAIGGILKSEGE